VRDTRRALGASSVGLLATAAAVTLLVPLGATLGAALFALVVVLVGILFVRFHPEGDLWAWFHERGINPWIGVAGVLLLALAFGLFRLGLLGWG
jgi:hypothetical protein